jgi:hypothetical protein
MLQLIAFAAIALFTTGVVGVVIRPFLQREGITFTRAGIFTVALVICGSSAGLSVAMFPELPEITASEPVAVEVVQEKARPVTKADVLVARATQLVKESSERAYRVNVETTLAQKGEVFERAERVDAYIAGVEEEARVLQGYANTLERLRSANETVYANRNAANVIRKLERAIDRLED